MAHRGAVAPKKKMTSECVHCEIQTEAEETIDHDITINCGRV
jgi:hypothetical protein